MSWTIDDSTIASTPGNIELETLQWIKHYPFWPIFLALGFLIPLAWGLLVSRGFLRLALYGLVYNLIYWMRTKKRFKLGDARPGIILSLDPMLIAVSTDLSKGRGFYPVIKIIRKRLISVAGQKPKVGLRLVTVALYKDHAIAPGSKDYWKDFDPRPATCATSNSQMIDQLMDSFDEDEWIELQNSLTQVPKPYKPGLYHVKI